MSTRKKVSSNIFNSFGSLKDSFDFDGKKDQEIKKAQTTENSDIQKPSSKFLIVKGRNFLIGGKPKIDDKAQVQDMSKGIKKKGKGKKKSKKNNNEQK